MRLYRIGRVLVRARRWAYSRPALGLAAFALGLFPVHALLARALWERDRAVELCVDGEEVRALTDADDVRTHDFLAEAADGGVTSVAVYWDPSHPLRATLREWERRLPEGMDVILRPEAAPFGDWRPRWRRASRLPAEGPPVTGLLFSGATVMGYPDAGFLEPWIASSTLRLISLELVPLRGFWALAERFPERLVRGHAVGEGRMEQSDLDSVRRRLRRAVRERGVRFLYVRLFPGLSAAENQGFLASLGEDLRSRKWSAGRARTRYGDWSRAWGSPPRAVRQIAAFLAATLIPLWGFASACRRRRAWRAGGRAAGACVLGGALAAACLSAPEFALGIAAFRGIRAAFLLPLGVAVFALYRAREIRHFFREPVTVGRLALGGLLVGAVALLVLGSPDGGSGSLDGAAWVRARLESWLGIRPRFKEFLVGHPCLWIGLYLQARGRALVLPAGKGTLAQAVHFLFHDPRPFLLIGFVGLLSVVNAFCQPSWPLSSVVLRTFHGGWLGSLLGLAAALSLRWGETRWSRLP